MKGSWRRKTKRQSGFSRRGRGHCQRGSLILEEGKARKEIRNSSNLSMDTKLPVGVTKIGINRGIGKQAGIHPMRFPCNDGNA